MSEYLFKISGSEDDYTLKINIEVNKVKFSCSCFGWRKTQSLCKHVLSVLAGIPTFIANYNGETWEQCQKDIKKSKVFPIYCAYIEEMSKNEIAHDEIKAKVKALKQNLRMHLEGWS